MIGEYKELERHIGHEIECVVYGDKNNPHNVSVECIDCYEVIVSADNPRKEVAK